MNEIRIKTGCLHSQAKGLKQPKMILLGKEYIHQKYYGWIFMDKPWIVRHNKSLLKVSILCVFIGISLLIVVFLILLFPFFREKVYTVYHHILLVVLSGCFFIAGLLLGDAYKCGKKFDDVVNALEMDLVDIKLKRWSTLKCTSLRYGRFSLYYFSGGEYSPPYYKLSIPTSKRIPDRLLWRAPRKVRHFAEWIEVPGIHLSKKISDLQVNRIKSLSHIRIKTYKDGTRIEARFNDVGRYFETSDILETLEVLREIERGL